MTNSRASLRSGNCPISIGIGVRFGSEQVSAFIGIRIFSQIATVLYPAEFSRCAERFPNPRLTRGLTTYDHFRRFVSAN